MDPEDAEKIDFANQRVAVSWWRYRYGLRSDSIASTSKERYLYLS